MKAEDVLRYTNGGLDIYRKFLGEIPEGGKAMRSPFRDDKNPSFSVKRLGDRWRHKDFGNDEYSGDAFHLAALHYKLDVKNQFAELLECLQRDFVQGYIEPKPLPPPTPRKRQSVFFTDEQVKARLGHSRFTKHVLRYADEDNAREVFQAYNLGRLDFDTTVYWYTSDQGEHRAYKWTKYRANGDTLTKKDENGDAQARFKPPREGLAIDRQLFGAHLIPKNPGKPVVIVEAEDTAIICAAVWGNAFVWTASGGTLCKAHCAPCVGRDVLVMPDFDILTNPDKFKAVQRTVDAMNVAGIGAKVWPLLHKLHPLTAGRIPEARRARMDARDYIEALTSPRPLTP